MAREDLITKNDAKYIINTVIEHIEAEDFPYESVLEMLGHVKEIIDELEPVKEPSTPSPCERDGHNYKDIYISNAYGYVVCYCTKCGETKKIQF